MTFASASWKSRSLLLGLLGISSLFVSCGQFSRRTGGPAFQRFEMTQPQMGVPFRMVVYATNEQHGAAAMRAAFARVEQLNSILSDYDTDSELSQLSRSSGKNLDVPASLDLWKVLRRSQELARKTDGAFDITVGPFVNLWRKARREQKLPRPDLLAQAHGRVGWRKLHLNPLGRTVRLDVEDMRLDLGAIAKGYAVDEAMKILATNGIRSALVSGGGDMAVSGPPVGRSAWQIELAPLDVTNAPAGRFVHLKHAALATSGDVFQHVEIDGVRYSHIVNPHTGVGLTDHSLVTVIAPDCMTADSLATAISVLGPDQGLRLLGSGNDVAAQIMRAPGGRIEVRSSERFAKYLGRSEMPPSSRD
jgi:thiamine biosynthesis lipoprotein